MNVVKNRKIGFLGAGNMAQAMMERWVSEKTLPLENIYVSNRSRRKLEKIKDTWLFFMDFFKEIFIMD